MQTDDAQERRALADDLEIEIGRAVQVVLFSMSHAEARDVVAALRTATPDHREARVRAAEAMRERAADLAVEISSPTDCWYVGDQIATAIRALSIPEAAPEDDGWRTMESAPRDGTPIILAIPLLAENGSAADYIRGEAYFCVEDDETLNGLFWWANEGPGDYHADPVDGVSHALARWRPLPSPPRALSTGPGGGDGR